MLKVYSVAILGATLMAFATLPAQALELGPVQVIVQPRVVVVPERQVRPRVVVVERERARPVVIEKRVVVVRQNGHKWDHRDHRRGHARGHDRDRWDRDGDRYERVANRDVIVIRR